MRTLIAALLLVGCQATSDRVPPHTVLTSVDPKVSVWSYQPLADGSHRRQTLNPDEPIRLQNGAIVVLTGGLVLVNGEPITQANAVIGRDGQVHDGAFIRTFK